MKQDARHILLFPILVIGIITAIKSCKQKDCALPDFTAAELVLDWSNKKATATIKNIGSVAANNVLVAFDAVEDPTSDNHRPQIILTVPSLGVGEAVTLTADFGPLAHPDNADLSRIREIVVTPDYKKIIDECNEDNSLSKPISPE